MKKAFTGGIALVLLVPLLVVFLVFAGAECDPAAGAPGDDSGDGKTVDPDDIPVDSIGPYERDPQLKHAAIIMNAAADAGLSKRAQIIGVMTAIGESTLINVGHGDSAGPDSRGLFQQRSQGWGTEDQRMDPYTAATGFYGTGDHATADGLTDIDGWESMELTLAANKVQRNADPYHYAQHEDIAREIVDTLADVPLTDDNAAAAARLTAPAAAGLINPAAATVPLASGNYDDDVYDRLKDSLGPVKPHVLESTTVIATVTGHEPGDIGGYREGGSRDPNGHPAGLAVDFMVPLTDEGKAQGDKVAQYAIDNAEHLNVKYVIWYQRIWNIGRDTDWRPMEDRGSDTQNHLDHPHISFEATPAGDPRDADDAPSLPGGEGTNPECEAEAGGDGNYPPGENEPGPWGGHDNGRIPREELKEIPWASHESLRTDAAEQLIDMNSAYREEHGFDLFITDAYRTYEEQEHLYNTKPPGYAAKPGTSKHGWALAVDISTAGEGFDSSVYKWLAKNAGRYGYKNPEWAQPGGSAPEAWHWEFWGVKE